MDRIKVLEEYKTRLASSAPSVYGFFEEHRPLSNFHEEPFSWKGIVWPSSENAYQCAKDYTSENISKFVKLSPMDSKKLGMKVSLCSNWELIKVPIMRDILIEKFSQCKIAKECLLSTDDMPLAENNWWRDQTWGVYNGYGKNYLGKILMEVRAIIR